VYPLAPSLDTVGMLGADLAAVELGMRLIEPGFTVPSSVPLIAGRLRPAVASEVDAAVDEAADARDRLRHWFAALLADQGFLVLPVLSGPPPLLGNPAGSPPGISLTLLTVPVNAAGLPALAVPLPGHAYPMALQVIGPAGSDEQLLAFGRAIEQSLTSS
jgi:Asp-tRNA(Asn)/Glu-tRNA(Gln) amidotransferase A subunit family amidase